MSFGLQARPASADADRMAARMLALRRDDQCVSCGMAVSAGARAWWDPATRTVTCGPCQDLIVQDVGSPNVGELDLGRPGASLGREYERRRTNREQRIRAAHPRLGSLLVALTDGPQHELAFHRGEVAERTVADVIERRTADGPAVSLHNRRMPDRHGDIDHLAVAPTGVFVIDTKDWAGSVRVAESLFARPKLLINGRDRSKLVDGLERQVVAVRTAIEQSGRSDVSVHGALCFTQGDLPLHRPQQIRGHLVLYPRALARKLNARGRLTPAAITEIAYQLSVAFPPA